MPKLFVTDQEGAEKQVEAATGLTLMKAIRNNGFDEMMALCGGCCSCATCHVFVDPGFVELLPSKGEDEDALLDNSSRRQRIRAFPVRSRSIRWSPRSCSFCRTSPRLQPASHCWWMAAGRRGEAGGSAKAGRLRSVASIFALPPLVTGGTLHILVSMPSPDEDISRGADLAEIDLI